MKVLVAACLLVAAVAVAVAAATGGEADRETGAAATAGPVVPDVSVAHLDGGATFALADLERAAKPTLLWFWAPWCVVCNGEAPKIERLAAQAGDELRVIAIGGRARASDGRPFVAHHGLRSPLVLFDEPMAAWSAYAIPGQPAAVLLDRNGRERRRWLGAFDTAQALGAAQRL